MTAQTRDYSGIEIEVTQGSDVGCEITDAEWERLEQAQIDALERAFPGAQIEVHTLDGSRSTAVDVRHEDPDDTSAELPDESDVTAVLDAVWDEGSFWVNITEEAEASDRKVEQLGVDRAIVALREAREALVRAADRLDREGVGSFEQDECSCAVETIDNALAAMGVRS